MWILLLACAPKAVTPASAAPVSPTATIADDARDTVARMRAVIGDPYATDGLHFVFVVGDMRREHHWDVRHDKVAVRYTREDGVVCSVTTTVGYDGPVEEQRTAWEMFVNDQFWLLAPAKVADAGATVTRADAGIVVRYDGVGVTPGDTYRFQVDDAGVVTGWNYTLGSGRTGLWAWAPPTAVGPLRLSLERTMGPKVIRFEDVRVEPITLGEPSVDCPLKTPAG